MQLLTKYLSRQIGNIAKLSIGTMSNAPSSQHSIAKASLISKWIERILTLGSVTHKISLEYLETFGLVKWIPVSRNKLVIRHRALIPSLAAIPSASSVLRDVNGCPLENQVTGLPCRRITKPDRDFIFFGAFEWSINIDIHRKSVFCPCWKNRKGPCLDFQVNMQTLWQQLSMRV